MSAWTCRSTDQGRPIDCSTCRRIPCWKDLGADSEEKREPVSDIDTAVVDSLKVLDLKRPIEKRTWCRAYRPMLGLMRRAAARSASAPSLSPFFALAMPRL